MSLRVWLLSIAVFGLAASFLTAVPARAVTIDWVTVGDPGNAADTTGYGAVNYEYRIGKYEVTIGQYAEFLNAAAKSDPYGLWNSSMQVNLNIAGISRSGSSGDYTYDVMTVSGSAPYGGVSNANRPIAFVNWWDAARFANWMHNGQGAGSTETGAYSLGGATSGNAPAVNPGATFSIPTENEWYKAAYFSPVRYSGSAGYYAYATQSNQNPGNAIGSAGNQANFYASDYAVTQSSSYSASQNYLTDVGAFTAAASYYGTFDQTGNLMEWNDLTGAAGAVRGLRGGFWVNDIFFGTTYLASTGRSTFNPSNDANYLGFRLASPVAVPEPATYAMALAGIACGGFLMWRRRKRA